MITAVCISGFTSSKSTVLLFQRLLLPTLFLLQFYTYYNYYRHFQSSFSFPNQSITIDQSWNSKLTERETFLHKDVSVSNVLFGQHSKMQESFVGAEEKVDNNPSDNSSSHGISLDVKIQSYGSLSNSRHSHLSFISSGRKAHNTGSNDPFLIVADHRSGFDWFAELLRKSMNKKDESEPNVKFCIGSTSILKPEKVPRDTHDSSCRYFEWSFVRDNLNRMFPNIETLQERCSLSKSSNEAILDDTMKIRLTKLCGLVHKDSFLNNTNKDEKNGISIYIDDAMAEIWLDNLRMTPGDDELPFDQCYCMSKQDSEHIFAEDATSHKTKTLRGIPIMSDWITSNEKRFSNLLFNREKKNIQKVVHLIRDNIWNRYIETNHDDIVVQAYEKVTISEQNISKDPVRRVIPIQDLFGFVEWLQAHDAKIDDFLLQRSRLMRPDAKDRAEPTDIEILWIEYDSCRMEPSECINGVLNFLLNQGHMEPKSSQTVGNQRILEGEYTPNYLDFTSNSKEIIELLCAIGECSSINQSIATASSRVDGITQVPYRHSDLYHLIYERRPRKPVRTVHVFHDMTTITFNTPENVELPSTTIGSKWDMFISPLESLVAVSPDATVVLSDDQGASYSSRIHNVSHIIKLIVQFRSHYLQLTRGFMNPVVVSTSHVVNEQNYAVNTSGWNDDTVKTRELYRGEPDGNFLSGSARNILRFVKNRREFLLREGQKDRSDAESLREFIYLNSENVVLDHEQFLFGNGFVITCPRSPYQEGTQSQSQTQKDPSTLFFYNEISDNCLMKLDENHQDYPKWGDSNKEGRVGINIESVITHIDRKHKNNSFHLDNVDPYFGTELLYIVDNRGVWSSDTERDVFRIQPTDKLLLIAQSNLMKISDRKSARWPNLVEVVSRPNGAGFPYWAWYGDLKKCGENNSIDANGYSQSVPLITTCAIVGCNYSFPTPAYMTIIDAQSDAVGFQYIFKEADKKFPWESKVRKVVWRGSLSESVPAKVFESVRWRLCRGITSLSIDDPRKMMFDVAFTEIPSFLTDQIEVDADLVGGVQRKSGRMEDFQRYLAILDMDGNSWSSRFGTLLCYNSVAIKVEPAYEDHFFRDLIPWKHYVPVKADLSDLYENVQFILDEKNDWIARNIVNTANIWCAERFTHTELANDMLDTWETYVRMLNQYDINWHDRWAKKRQEVSVNSNLILLEQK